MKTEESSKKAGDGEEKPKTVKNTALDLQRMKLEKLMKNPEKPVVIPDRQKEKKTPHVPDFVRNVMGSSAGAGSGEFHVYRHLRRKEYARQKAIGEKGEKAAQDEAFQLKLLENQKQAEERTAKKRAKRLKKKKNLKKKKIENAKAGVKLTDPPSEDSSLEDSDREESVKDCDGSESNPVRSNPTDSEDNS
uniref:PRKR-interacting protein 1 n=1 Tax=Lygus hesperus TaxID=30085 RepID=A0A0K8SMU9_LYGHE